jgi:putative acetyltransferase
MVVIKPIKEHQIEQAKQIVITVSLEIWQGELSAADLKRIDSMSDISNVKSHYFDNRGLFLVLVDGEQVVGTGAIRQLSREICELKRMWFLKPYRGQGLGQKMAQILFDFARNEQYQKVRLDLANEQRQFQAIHFYKKLGFYVIERYNDSPCTVFMEKVL